MSRKLVPSNLMAQLHHRAIGNPANSLPTAAISNCFPGLDYDFKNFWRRTFVGLVLLEWDNYVVECEDRNLQGLLHHRLLKVEGVPLVTRVSGPQIPNGPPVDLPSGKPGVVTMEWSNALAFIRSRHGQSVTAVFTANPSEERLAISDDPADVIEVQLQVRQIFEDGSLAVKSDYLKPGELTQGLCSPWQHDYRECSCYYWPASRPDYVNVRTTSEGVSAGDNWISKGNRTGEYVLDDRRDSRLVSYNDLFVAWEKELRFQIRGRDSEESV